MNNDPITSEEIDALLDVYRPDRYDSNDHGWWAPIIGIICGRITQAQAQQIAAERLVSQRESKATRSVNQMLRRVGREQQFPMEGTCDDLLRRPLSIGSERICLGVAEPADLRQWAIDERRDAAQEASARFAACDGAEWLADQVEDKGFHTFGEAVAS